MMLIQRTVLGFLVIPERSLCEVSAVVFDSHVNSIRPVSLWSYLVAACEVCWVVDAGTG